jgi:hypothetical protein
MRPPASGYSVARHGTAVIIMPEGPKPLVATLWRRHGDAVCSRIEVMLD